jgi:2-polyprenyl-6-methoxyphenol hydroxylase-like FAD-dependent oxidoreductase
VRSLVLESSPSLRASGFAFTTWKNAFRALDALGVGDKIREQHLQARAYVVTSNNNPICSLDLADLAAAPTLATLSPVLLLNFPQVARRGFRHRRNRARSRLHKAGETVRSKLVSSLY